MKYAIGIDWLDKYAGSERVIRSMCKSFDFSKVYTLTTLMTKADLDKTFNSTKPKLYPSSLKYLGRFFRAFSPFFARELKVSSDVDILITSSHAVAKSIKKPENTFHMSYFQARNMKYIWEENELYFSEGKKLFFPILPLFRCIDKKEANNPDLIIINSRFVQKWVKDVYNRESLLIYPSVNVDSFQIGTHCSNSFVIIGRLDPYKRFDLIIDAFNANGKKLIVIGGGSQRNKLQKNAKENIQFVGYLDSSRINEYLMNAKGFVYAGVEDFGIARVEAQVTGCPVICLNKAGTAETVIDGKTGVLFDCQTVESLNAAIDRFSKLEPLFSYSNILARHSENNLERSQEYGSKNIRRKRNNFLTCLKSLLVSN